MPTSAWGPMGRPLFRTVWTAGLAANVGVWMQNVGAAWVMTDLSSSAALVALVQAAMTFPMLLLAFLAGALADVLDGRRLLIATQVWMVLVVAALAGLIQADGLTPAWLLLLTALFGVGVALSMPAWQVIVFELVPREELAQAVTLNGVAINLARAIGPTVGGILLAWVGGASMFVANAVVLLLAAGLLLLWRRQPTEAPMNAPAEHVAEAVQAGIRFVRYEPVLQRVLVRAGLFIAFGSALWALLPIVARRTMGLDALGYGALLGCMGVGAVAGALLLPRVRERASLEIVVGAGTAAFMLACLVLAYLPSVPVVAPTLVVAGGAWLVLISCFAVAALGRLPTWVRARATAAFLLVFFGAMTVGSIVWGLVAQAVGVPLTLTTAAVASLACFVVAPRLRLPDGPPPDSTPGHRWPFPALVREPSPEAGPVVITVEYRVDPDRAADFRRAMRAVRLERLRDGAVRWNLFCDPDDPWRHFEVVTADTWGEHRRAHERATVADWAHEECARRFHVGPEPPRVTHLVAEPV